MNSWSEVSIPVINSVGQYPPLFLSDTASATKKKVEQKKHYRMYVCGITPYDATHLGHAATYLTFDLINRFLRATGSEVTYVQNITDIDDPLLERANRDGVDWKDLAHQQIDLFRGDMENLRVIPPAHYIGAVDAIPLVVEAINDLASLSTIYAVDTDHYFSVHADSRFGTRSHLTQEQMLSIFAERGGDPKRAGKTDPLDCLVWMSQRVNEPGWQSSLGVGRPGWHIECTAIALKYLNPSDMDQTLIDIQGGGSDLIFPHHEMCAAPMAIRWALMSDHYRSDRMWSDSVLKTAEDQIIVLKNALNGHDVAPTDEAIAQIIHAISDDLDTPKVISILMRWSSDSSTGARGGSATELRAVLDALLGLKL